MKPITISPVSLVLGALLALGLFLVMGQAVPSSYGTWGPPKKGVVNIFEEPVPNLPLPAGGSVVIYQVPADRWLTVTGTTVNSNGGQGLRWSEQLGGVYTDKGFATTDNTHGLANSPAGSESALGWVFRPGSQVLIRNTTPGPLVLYYHALIGYETRD